MIRWGLILAAVIIAVGAWFDWTYHAIRTEIAELSSSLPSEEELNRDTGEQLKAAVADCARVESLKSNLIAKVFKDKALAALTERCDLIKSRHDSLEGP
jgi:hypothetical protein